MYSLAAKPNQKDLDFVTKLAADDIIKPVIDRYYSLEHVADAIRYISEGHASGKVIIRLD
jgi:NADPH:quinone reductase-like Zn-dependent oxidoreductase